MTLQLALREVMSVHTDETPLTSWGENAETRYVYLC
jgi:hypothetical protein